jgi:hypothetical protein
VLMFFPLMTLMADAARVIEIRLGMMALGQGTPGEMFLMVSEKMNAMEEAKAIIARGGNPHSSSKTIRRLSPRMSRDCQDLGTSDLELVAESLK